MSRLFQHLKNGDHGQLIERYAARLIEDGLLVKALACDHPGVARSEIVRS